jgi:pimeloyl-ACP methyl ester carboxylesterase
MNTHPHLDTAMPDLNPAQRTFRRARINAFTSRGFDVSEAWVARPDGGRTYVVCGGEGDCPKVLVHAGIGNTADWAPLAPLLDGRVVIADTPGFGLSYAPAGGYSNFGAVSARWILEVIEGIGADRVDLIGCSMGGYGAINFAATHPERVRRLVLSGSVGGLFCDIGRFLKLWTIPFLGRAVSNVPMRNIETVRTRMFGPYVADPTALPDDLLEVALIGMNLPGARTSSRAIVRSVATHRGWRPDMRVDDLLARTGIDTVFVWGDRDVHASPQVARDLSSRMANARVIEITGAGHLPHLDHPQAVAAAIH